MIRVCFVGRRENRKDGVVDHLGERNEKGERGPLSYDVWYAIPLTISPIQERLKLGCFKGFGVPPLIPFFLFSLRPNNYERQNRYTNPSIPQFPKTILTYQTHSKSQCSFIYQV